MELREKFISSNKHPTTLWIFHIFYYTSYTFCIYPYVLYIFASSDFSQTYNSH